MIRKLIFVLVLAACLDDTLAQRPFAHEAAIHRDSSIFTGWASTCTVTRGWQQVGNASLGYASAGTESGVAGAGGNGTVSLGDGGSALVGFSFEIRNGAGPDFAVFENGFPIAGNDTTFFLELAYVDVSSDGTRFVRFPSRSLTDTSVQIDNAHGIDPRNVYNLAGRYMGPWGTPFDLEEIKDSVGIDVNHITHVRLTDVTGRIDTVTASRDVQGRIINDPWPTPFPISGFDLDAIGVINRQAGNGFGDVNARSARVLVYPQPARSRLFVSGVDATFDRLGLTDLLGKKLLEMPYEQNMSLDVAGLQSGVYLLYLEGRSEMITRKIIVRHE